MVPCDYGCPQTKRRGLVLPGCEYGVRDSHGETAVEPWRERSVKCTSECSTGVIGYWFLLTPSGENITCCVGALFLRSSMTPSPFRSHDTLLFSSRLLLPRTFSFLNLSFPPIPTSSFRKVLLTLSHFSHQNWNFPNR